MSVLHGALGMGRKRAVSRFTESFTAYTTSRVLDEAGEYTDAETVLYADVGGRVKFPTMTVSEPAQAGQVMAVQDIEVHVRVGATPDVVVGVLWRVEGSTVDPSLTGRVFRTKGLPHAGSVTAHRYPVVSV